MNRPTAAQHFYTAMREMPAPAPEQGIEWERLNDEVESLNEQGLYDRAEVVAKKALAVAEKAVGPDHCSVVISLGKLAALYRAQGQYTQAEPLHTRALAIVEKILGPDNSFVAISLNNLAGLYYYYGKYTES